MFLGTVPSDVTKILHEHAEKWNVKDIYVGCSGNFTIERSLADLNVRLHSCDVSLYSSALGSHFSGQEIDVTLNEEYREQFPFLEDSIKTPADLAATLMLCTTMLKGLGTENEYYARIRKAYADQWKTLHEKTVNRLKASKLKVADYYAGDVMTYIDSIPEEAAFVCFPPFYAGDYEKIFSNIGKVFKWTPPGYTPFSKEESLKMMYEKAQTKAHWFMGTGERIDFMEPDLDGMVQKTNRGTIIYCYTDMERPRIAVPKQKTTILTHPRLSPGDVITPESEIRLVKLKLEEFVTLRSMFMDKSIKPSSPTYALAVLVDNKIAGCCAFNTGGIYQPSPDHLSEQIYMLSDFPVEPTDYPRLSKLVLYAALSKESQRIAWDVSHMPIRSATTTGFSKNEVSMKYRGIFELVSRKKVPGDRPFQLQYMSPMGRWTLKEGLNEWLSKYQGGKKENE